MKKMILVALCFYLMKNNIFSQTVMPLYKATIPNSKETNDEEKADTTAEGIIIISKISRPTLTRFQPKPGSANGTAVIVIPGGGYSINANGHEGIDIAREFAAMGVTAFVLKYRIPNDATMINKEIGPLQDIQQAIKTVREQATTWGLNPDRLGVIGFSAGGHLASTAGTHYEKITISNIENTSLRPNFMMLIYPVISLVDSTIAHKGSAENLLGKKARIARLMEYSNELNVNAKTPPTFLVHASDDNGVSPLNSIRFYEALVKNKVPAELHIYQNGGHGFGLTIKNTQEQWMERCRNWMEKNGWLKK